MDNPTKVQDIGNSLDSRHLKDLPQSPPVEDGIFRNPVINTDTTEGPDMMSIVERSMRRYPNALRVLSD